MASYILITHNIFKIILFLIFEIFKKFYILRDPHFKTPGLLIIYELSLCFFVIFGQALRVLYLLLLSCDFIAISLQYLK